MKNLIYQCVFEKNYPALEYFTNSVKDYCRKYNIDYFCQKTPQLYISSEERTPSEKYSSLKTEKQFQKKRDFFKKLKMIDEFGFWPEFEKFNIFSIKNYDNICFIDSHIFIKNHAPNIFDLLEDFEIGLTYEFDQPHITKENIKKYSISSFQDFYHLKDEVSFPVKKIHECNVIDVVDDDILLINNNFLEKYFKNININDWLNQEDFERFIHHTKDAYLHNGFGSKALLNYWIWKSNINVKKIDYSWNLKFHESSYDLFSKFVNDSSFINFGKNFDDDEFVYSLEYTEKNNFNDELDSKTSLSYLKKLLVEIDQPSKAEIENLKFTKETIEKIKDKATKIANAHDENASFQSSDVGFIIHQLLKVIRQLQRENI